MFEKTLNGFEYVARRFVWFGGALLIGAACMVTVDVFARKLFNASLAGSDEISGYAFGISTMLAMAYALIHRTNIRVDAFYHHFPRPLRAFTDILGLVLLVGFVAMLTYLGYNLLADSLAHGSRSITPLRTPLAIPQTAWLLGAGFCVLTGMLLAGGALVAAFRGDWPAVQRRIGIKSVDEQIEEETA